MFVPLRTTENSAPIARLWGGAKVAETVEALEREGITTCRQTVWRLRRHFQ